MWMGLIYLGSNDFELFGNNILNPCTIICMYIMLKTRNASFLVTFSSQLDESCKKKHFLFKMAIFEEEKDE